MTMPPSRHRDPRAAPTWDGTMPVMTEGLAALFLLWFLSLALMSTSQRAPTWSFPTTHVSPVSLCPVSL